MKMLISLVSGVNGHSGVCHGGMIALLLDKVTGLMVAKTQESRDTFTLSFANSFVKPLYTPTVVLCRA